MVALRCIYHGWLYDIHGNCLDQPEEPEHSRFKGKVKHPADPCREMGGMIFTYMGPGEPPFLPAYDFLTLPDAHRFVTKYHHDCSYLQGNEGNIDPQHLSFLHRFFEEEDAGVRGVIGSSRTADTYYSEDVSPTIEVEEADFGLASSVSAMPTLTTNTSGSPTSSTRTSPPSPGAFWAGIP